MNVFLKQNTLSMSKFNCLIHFFLFSLQIIYSQTNVDVEYKLTIDPEDDYNIKMSETVYFKNRMEEEIIKMDSFRFKLVINDTLSSFYLSKEFKNQKIEYTESSKKDVFFALYTGAIYGRNNSFYRLDTDLNVFSTTIAAYEWEILNETKEIDGFLCYKAITVKTIKNPSGNFSSPVVAWFCPKLSYSAGPLDFNGLPGLILQVKYRGATYEATKINLKSELKIDLKLFDQHKKLSLDEYIQYSDEKIKSFGKN